MARSKKDFISLADELRQVVAGDAWKDDDSLWNASIAVNALCRFMAKANPRFNEARWRAYLAGECGPSGGAMKKPKRAPAVSGPVCPKCSIVIWDKAHGSKLAKCWNCMTAFDAESLNPQAGE